MTDKFFGIAQDGIESAVIWHLRNMPERFRYYVLDAAKMQSGLTSADVPDDEAVDTLNEAMGMIDDVLFELKDKPEVYEKLGKALDMLISLTD